MEKKISIFIAISFSILDEFILVHLINWEIFEVCVAYSSSRRRGHLKRSNIENIVHCYLLSFRCTALFKTIFTAVKDSFTFLPSPFPGGINQSNIGRKKESDLVFLFLIRSLQKNISEYIINTISFFAPAPTCWFEERCTNFQKNILLPNFYTLNLSHCETLSVRGKQIEKWFYILSLKRK